MDNYILYIGLIVLLEINILGYFLYRIHISNNNIKAIAISNEMERLKLYADFDFDKAESRLDKYIDNAGQIYKLYHFNFKSPDDIYLNQEEIEQMVTSITKDVYNRITPAMLSLFRLSYNIETDDDLITIICERVKLYVLSYSLDTNKDIEE